MRTNLLGEFIRIVKNEYLNSESNNQYLLLAMIFNIPSPLIFIPYATQAITIFLVLFFLKRLVDMKKGTSILYMTIGLTLIFQILWIPYISQLVSITLIGIIFAFNKKLIKS